ncbi:replication initiation negative regulator SeqA [Candidatus Enterovibrio altilux]|uniref:Negative modulator of initiation of replication n=1 Tax=Candidatus Enterovibrio altilux TaxID=1927128 RepID=A0A291B7K2_9GAMM|nr:replication initiation negative regulator SeqA [Candidatus Enterovibrio luxaltus]ATF08985.1 SeqA protein, negative modulator of initiation of replication [Candidatus Enterovibrio luxaltus]
MKTIEVDEELYRYIASQTQHIGESASDILRRLLMVPLVEQSVVTMLNTVPNLKYIKDTGKSNTIKQIKEIHSLLISDEFISEDNAIGRFMLVLSTLYRIDGQSFSVATALKGRTRVYFADNEQILLKSGKTTKPKHIPSTPFWVITNTNTSRKRQMIEKLMTRMGFTNEISEKVIDAI